MTDTNTNVETFPAWKRLVEIVAFGNYPYGHLFSDEWVAEMLRIDRSEDGKSVSEFKRMELEFLRESREAVDRLLREHRIYLHRVTGQGWIKAKPSDQHRLAMDDHYREHKRLMSRTLARVVHARFEEMTAAERADNVNAQALLARQRQHAPKPIEWKVPADQRESDERSALLIGNT